MAKLIALATATGTKIWVSPEHVTKLSNGGIQRTIIELVDGEGFVVGGEIDDIAEAINRAR